MEYIKSLISIIVPVYNVEEYLEQCIDSLINQTYKKIEIIMVDDGSTDRSGMMCDELAKKDNRIRVIHKNNGGLSDARNAGMDIAKGEWIGFVDSDDYVEKDMYETLIKLCNKFNVKISSARFNEFGEGIQDQTPKENGKIISADCKDFIKWILFPKKEQYMTISVWDRLYHRSILEGMEFPVGKCYEDIVYSIEAILKAQKCAYINKSLYHYRLRDGSITHSVEYSKKVDIRYITDRLPLEREQIYLLSNEGYFDLANLAKAAYYKDYLYIKSNSGYDEYLSSFSMLSDEWNLPLHVLLGLDIDLKRKIIIMSKMKMGFIWNIYYKYIYNIK